jgi:hypothetical protein
MEARTVIPKIVTFFPMQMTDLSKSREQSQGRSRFVTAKLLRRFHFLVSDLIW